MTKDIPEHHKMMRKPTKIILIFVLIFIIGVLGFVTYINQSLKKNSTQFVTPSEEITPESPEM